MLLLHIDQDPPILQSNGAIGHDATTPIPYKLSAFSHQVQYVPSFRTTHEYHTLWYYMFPHDL